MGLPEASGLRFPACSSPGAEHGIPGAAVGSAVGNSGRRSLSGAPKPLAGRREAAEARSAVAGRRALSRAGGDGRAAPSLLPALLRLPVPINALRRLRHRFEGTAERRRGLTRLSVRCRVAQGGQPASALRAQPVTAAKLRGC